MTVHESSTAAPAPRGRIGPFAWGAWGLAAVLAFVLPGVLGYGVIDDAYISLRYSRNLAEGLGLVFNAGEAVEGYTNFLWTVLVAGAIRVGFDAVAFSYWAGIAAGVAALLVALRLQVRLAPADARGVACGLRLVGTPLFVVASPTFLAYAASGLESAAFTLLLVVHVVLLLGTRSGAGGPRALAAAGVVLALANLTRPEATALFVFDLVALALLLVLGRRREEGPLVSARGIGAFALGFAVPFGAFLLWRHATYGLWLPNTFYAKVGGPSAGLLGAGGTYAVAVALRSLAVVAIPLGLFTAWRRADLRFLYVAALALVLLLVTALVGGDHMALWRFGVPVLPLSAVLLSEGLSTVLGERRPSWVAALTVVVAGVGAGLWTGRSVRQFEMAEHARAQLEVELAEDWEAFGTWLTRYAEPDDAIALLPIGAIGFASRLPVIDQVGLVDAHIGRLEVETGQGYVGHEKYDNAYVLGRRPRFVLANHQVRFPRAITQAEYDGAPFFEVHRDLLRRPELRRDYVFRCLRAGDRRFYAFYERSDAVR